MKKTPAQLEAQQRWRDSHRDEIKAYNATRYAADPDKFRSRALASYHRHRSARIAGQKRWRSKNRPRRNAYMKRWAKENRPKITAQRRERYHSDPAYRIMCVLRATIACRLARVRAGRKSASTIKLLGCTITSFMRYLESHFQPGMSWTNYGVKWQIDHELPCAMFDLRNPEHQKACFHFSNLAPLWTEDNQRKSDKVPDHSTSEQTPSLL